MPDAGLAKRADLSYNKHLYEYQKQSVNTASPLRLTIMLYDGALRFLELGKAGLLAKNLFEKNDNLQKSQKIVMELMNTLDVQKGGEMAKNLMSLYFFVVQQLMEANIEDDVEKLDVAAKILRDLRESWLDVEKMTKSTQAPQSEETNYAA